LRSRELGYYCRRPKAECPVGLRHSAPRRGRETNCDVRKKGRGTPEPVQLTSQRGEPVCGLHPRSSRGIMDTATRGTDYKDLPPAACRLFLRWLLACLILRLCIWGRRVTPKRRFTLSCFTCRQQAKRLLGTPRVNCSDADMTGARLDEVYSRVPLLQRSYNAN
jgi:hypothetical protein